MVVSGFTLRHRAPEYAGDIPKSFYDFKMKSIDGKMIDFSSLKGKKVMCVNVASKCGQTPQYADLQKLNDMYGDKVVILGFPANNFGQQEPGTNVEIKEFCKENYGVTFQMFDDDMNLYYEGKIVGDYTGFEPLDDFGIPNAGCTSIWYCFT